jgi:multisubunit Na+/H+ antiporter MnhG subunit
VSAVACDLLLFFGVAASWLSVAGLFRLATPYDRIHCVGFVTLVAGSCFSVAVLVAHPHSLLGPKAIFAFIVMLCAGAVVAHATGRALSIRSDSREER